MSENIYTDAEVAEKLINALIIKGGDIVDDGLLATEQTLWASTTLTVDVRPGDFAVGHTVGQDDFTRTAGTYNPIITFTATLST